MEKLTKIENMEKFIELKKNHEFDLSADSPFNFKLTVCKPSHFPTSLEEFDKGSNNFYRTCNLGENVVGIKMSDLNKKEGKDGIFLEIYSTNKLDEQKLDLLKERVNNAYGLKENINEFYKNVEKNKDLNKIICNLNGMRNSCFENLYEILNISAMLQNTTVKRSEQMMKSMLSNFGKSVSFDNKELSVFYTPIDISKSDEQKLRELSVGYRAKFLMNLSNYFLENEGIEKELKKMTTEEAKNKLMEIKGVGPYTANLVLFSYLRNPDFINFDVWNKKILSKFLFNNENAPLEKINKECEKRWGKYKGYATLYIIENLFIKKPQ